MDSKEIYGNRAELQRDQQPKDCTAFECCDEELVFALKDRYHSFSIGFSTILQCLAFAEKEGYVPKLPDDWWIKVSIRN